MIDVSVLRRQHLDRLVGPPTPSLLAAPDGAVDALALRTSWGCQCLHFSLCLMGLPTPSLLAAPDGAVDALLSGPSRHRRRGEHDLSSDQARSNRRGANRSRLALLEPDLVIADKIGFHEWSRVSAI